MVVEIIVFVVFDWYEDIRGDTASAINDSAIVGKILFGGIHSMNAVGKFKFTRQVAFVVFLIIFFLAVCV